MGALHIEDNMHLMIGKLQRDTGWATILSQAEVLTSGRAQSTLDEHLSSHQAHEVCPPGIACSAVHAQAERIRTGSIAIT